MSALRAGDAVRVCRTTHFAEAEMLVDGERWLVCMPLDERAAVAVERMAACLRYVQSDFLTEYRLLYSELEVTDALGRKGACDIVIQRLPEGEPFAHAVAYYDPHVLRTMIDALRGEFVRLGFSHNNLKPFNVIVGDDGRLHPLRYHYATLDGGCRDDFTPLYAVIDPLREEAAETPAAELHDICAAYPLAGGTDGEVFLPHEGLIRICRDNRYGFMDEESCVVIEPKYMWADDFREGRAVVESVRGFGLIDKSGREVVEPRFDDLDYDVRSGRSTVRLDGKCAEFSYTGEQLTDFL